jgi:hypothetical protein
MTSAELLARCRALGIDLAVGPGGALLWEADNDPPVDLLADLASNKAAVLAVLWEGACDPCGRPLDALAELADWFTANTGRLPQEPFGLVRGRHSGWAVWVANPARFYVALRTDLAAGPSAARARTGALAADLRRLRALVEG